MIYNDQSMLTYIFTTCIKYHSKVYYYCNPKKLYHIVILWSYIDAGYIISYISQLKSLKIIWNKIDPNDQTAFIKLISVENPERKGLFLLICYHVGRFLSITKIQMLQLMKLQPIKNSLYLYRKQSLHITTPH